MPLPAASAVDALWRDAALDSAALARLRLSGTEPVLPSSFAVGTAGQASLGAAALASTEIGRLRNGVVQAVAVDMRDAALESCAAFTIDGVAPPVWDPIAGLYACAEGWIRLHTNFAQHRDGVLRLLGLPLGATTSRPEVAAALATRSAAAFESEATDAGLVVAALRSFETWDCHPQSASVAALPLVEITRIGAAPPLDCPDLPTQARPLDGLRVLDLTRILAGPVAGRTLAAHGADVLLATRRICRTSRRSPIPVAASARHWPICATPTTAAGSPPPSPARTCSCRATAPAASQRPASGPKTSLACARASSMRPSRVWPSWPLGGPARLRFAGADRDRLQCRRG